MKPFVVLLLCTGLLLSLCACAASGEPTSETPLPAAAIQTEPSSESAESTAPPTAEETVLETFAPWQPPEPGQEITLLYDEAFYSDDGTFLSYQVPLFCGGGADAARINNEILQQVGQPVQQILDGGSPDLICVSYLLCHFRVYTISLVLCCEYADGGRSYYTYTLLHETGAALSGSDLLAELNIGPENFLSEAKKRAGDVFAELCGDWDEDAFRHGLAFTCSEENIHPDMQMFADNDGHLMLISPIGSPDRLQIYSLQKEFSVDFP